MTKHATSGGARGGDVSVLGFDAIFQMISPQQVEGEAIMPPFGEAAKPFAADDVAQSEAENWLDLFMVGQEGATSEQGPEVPIVDPDAEASEEAVLAADFALPVDGLQTDVQLSEHSLSGMSVVEAANLEAAPQVTAPLIPEVNPVDQVAPWQVIEQDAPLPSAGVGGLDAAGHSLFAQRADAQGLTLQTSGAEFLGGFDATGQSQSANPVKGDEHAEGPLARTAFEGVAVATQSLSAAQIDADEAATREIAQPDAMPETAESLQQTAKATKAAVTKPGQPVEQHLQAELRKMISEASPLAKPVSPQDPQMTPEKTVKAQELVDMPRQPARLQQANQASQSMAVSAGGPGAKPADVTSETARPMANTGGNRPVAIAEALPSAPTGSDLDAERPAPAARARFRTEQMPKSAPRTGATAGVATQSLVSTPELDPAETSAKVTPERMDTLVQAQAADTPNAASQRSAPQPGAPQQAIPLNLRQADWGEQLVGRIERMVQGGAEQLELALRPKNLGELQLRIEMRGEQTTVHFVTETAAAARMLVGQEDKLSQLLDQSGFRLASLSAQTGGQGGANGQDGQPQGQRDNAGRIARARKLAPEETTGSVSAPTNGKGSGSGINMLA